MAFYEPLSTLRHVTLLSFVIYASLGSTTAFGLPTTQEECDSTYDDAVAQCEADAPSWDDEYDACLIETCGTASADHTCVQQFSTQTACTDIAAENMVDVENEQMECEDDASTEWGNCLVDIGTSETIFEDECDPMGWLEEFDPGLYFYYLGNPSAMDTDLEVTFYVAGTTAAVALGAAACLSVAGSSAAALTMADSNLVFQTPSLAGKAIGWNIPGVAAPQAAIIRTAAVRSGAALDPRITLPIARFWRDFYQSAVANNLASTTAPERLKLMNEIIIRLGGVP